MAALRRAYITHFLIALSCSTAAPSTSGTIQGVRVVEQITCQNNQPCANENIQGAALASGAVWVTRHTSTSTSGSSVNNTIDLEVVQFDGDAGATVVQQAPLPSVSSEVAATSDGSTVYFLDVEQGQTTTATLRTWNGGDAGLLGVPVNAGSSLGEPAGMVADTHAVIVAMASNTMGGSGPDEGFWAPGSLPPSTTDIRQGAIGRLNADDGGLTASLSPQQFVMTYSHHLMAADATDIYWIAGPTAQGEVRKAPRDLSSSSSVAPIQSGAAPVGLAVASGNVAWSSTADLLGTARGCWIWESSNLIFQSDKVWCMGLAIDSTDAYFATVEVRSSPPDGNGHVQTYLAATGLARVSLSGPSQQTPHVLPIDSNRLYGPRRLFVDSSYVYGIDPSYVLRAAKAAFPP